jgi:hypothetical protein
VGCEKLTDAAVSSLAKYCPSLALLDLSRCKVRHLAYSPTRLAGPSLGWLSLTRHSCTQRGRT